MLVFQDRELTQAEIAALTGKTRYSAQERKLRAVGLRPILRDDGSLGLTSLAVALAMSGGQVQLSIAEDAAAAVRQQLHEDHTGSAPLRRMG